MSRNTVTAFISGSAEPGPARHNSCQGHVAHPSLPIAGLLLLLIGWLVGLFTSSSTQAQSALRATSADTVLRQVTPYCDASTVLVGRIDLDGIDTAAIAQLVLDVVPGQKDELAGPVSVAQQAGAAWIETFRQAGGREIYVVLNLVHLSLQPPVIVVVPLGEGGDSVKLEATLKLSQALPDFAYKTADNCVVAAPKRVMERLDPIESLPPRDLVAAFSAEPVGVVQVAVFPYPGFDRVLTELMPVLPRVVGGGPSAPIAKGFRWAKLGIQSPPQGVLELVVQGSTVEDIEALWTVWTKGLAALGEQKDVQREMPQWPRLAAALTPQVQGNSMRLRLEQSDIVDLVSQSIMPAAEEGRRQALRTVTMNNLRQVGLAMHMYADDNDGRFPPHLADALPYLGSVLPLTVAGQSIDVPERFMEQGRDAKVTWLDAHSPVVYLQADAVVKEIRELGSTVLAHEKPEARKDSVVGVLNVDGSVQMLTLDEFRKRVPAE